MQFTLLSPSAAILWHDLLRDTVDIICKIICKDSRLRTPRFKILLLTGVCFYREARA